MKRQDNYNQATIMGVYIKISCDVSETFLSELGPITQTGLFVAMNGSPANILVINEPDEKCIVNIIHESALPDFGYVPLIEPMGCLGSSLGMDHIMPRVIDYSTENIGSMDILGDYAILWTCDHRGEPKEIKIPAKYVSNCYGV